MRPASTIDPHIENSYTQQFQFQVEREIDRYTTLSAGYTHQRGLHLIMARNVNVPTLPAAEATRLGIPNLGRPDPRLPTSSRRRGAAIPITTA